MVGLGQRWSSFSHRFSLQVDLAGAVYEAVEDGGGQGGVTDDSVPFFAGEEGAHCPSRTAAAILQAVARSIPSCFAARAGDMPASMSFPAANTVSGSSAGRPGFRPRFLAAAIPSRVRSEIGRRSKWAIAPNPWNTSSPAGEGALVRPQFGRAAEGDAACLSGAPSFHGELLVGRGHARVAELHAPDSTALRILLQDGHLLDREDEVIMGAPGSPRTGKDGKLHWPAKGRDGSQVLLREVDKRIGLPRATGSSVVGFNPSLQAHFSLEKTHR